MARMTGIHSETTMDASESKRQANKQPLVQATADALRETILAADPGTRIGSLSSLAESLGVGIVTVQQAARILEHEGLLEVRRGPGGGYYGMRPDKTALQRLIGTYIRLHPVGYAEALDIVTLLFCELVAAAAECRDQRLLAALSQLKDELDDCRTHADSGAFEERLQDLLFRMVDRPLFELLTTVALDLYAKWPATSFFEGEDGLAMWIAGRHRLIAAILEGDGELARFEARRHRRYLLARLGELAQRGIPPANDG